MINLIPTDHKQSIAYARHNTKLVGWLIGIAVAVVGLAIVVGGGLFYINQDVQNYKQAIAESEANLKAENEEEALARVAEISGRLSLVVDVLSREVLFSKLLPYLGSLMPEGTSLESLSLSREQAGGIDLSIGAVNEFAASQALVNLKSDKNLLFTAADANAVTCENTAPAVYPCTVTIRAILVDENPFRLLNQGEKKELKNE